jgi:hypothetical protein
MYKIFVENSELHLSRRSFENGNTFNIKDIDTNASNGIMYPGGAYIEGSSEYWGFLNGMNFLHYQSDY